MNGEDSVQYETRIRRPSWKVLALVTATVILAGWSVYVEVFLL